MRRVGHNRVPQSLQNPQSIPSDDRAMNHCLRSLYPSIREREEGITLPRRWDMTQAAEVLELSPDKLTVSFKKNVSSDSSKDSSAIIRGDSHIPASIGLYYFEVSIVKGDEGCMGIGLSKKGGHLNRMPGWDASCYGYHGDDGNSFSNCGTGKKYGPKFGTGDVIGCGIDTMLYQVFFTKNGRFLGVAYQEKTPFDKLYPTVGLKNPGEQLSVNFGQKPFVFDFIGFRKTMLKKKVNQLESTTMPDGVGNHMNRIVLSFLGDSGAIDTLQKFEKVANWSNCNTIESIKYRKEIVEMIMCAAQGSVIQETIEKYFPKIIRNDSRVQLILLCLRYIDLANTLQDPPSSFKIGAHIPSSAGTIFRPNKSAKNAQKRTRGDRSVSPLPSLTTRRPSSNTRSKDVPLTTARIREHFTDEDTGEEMIIVDGLTINKSVYADLISSDEYDKILYLIKMGREIMNISKTISLTAKEREIVELSMAIILEPKRNGNPLSLGQRRYIANLITIMINDHLSSKKGGNTMTSGKRVFSELRGMFIGWQGIHADASSRDNPASAVSFMKNMVIHPAELGEDEFYVSPRESETEAYDARQQDEDPTS